MLTKGSKDLDKVLAAQRMVSRLLGLGRKMFETNNKNVFVSGGTMEDEVNKFMKEKSELTARVVENHSIQKTAPKKVKKVWY